MSPSLIQILIIVAIAFLLFGAGRLPRVMEDLAKGIKSFKKGLADEDKSTPEKPEEPARIEGKTGSKIQEKSPKREESR